MPNPSDRLTGEESSLPQWQRNEHLLPREPAGGAAWTSKVGVPCVLSLAFVLGLALPSEAQGYRQGEQFASLSFGGGATTLHPRHFVWVDETFPEGLTLPGRDSRAPTMDFTLGAMTTRRLAVIGSVLEFTGAEVSDMPGRIWNLNFHAGVRYWMGRKVWIEGAVGPTWTSVAIGDGDDQLDSGRWGWGIVGAVGYDVLQMRDVRSTDRLVHIMLPVQARVSTNKAGDVRTTSTGLLLGFAVGW